MLNKSAHILLVFCDTPILLLAFFDLQYHTQKTKLLKILLTCIVIHSTVVTRAV